MVVPSKKDQPTLRPADDTETAKVMMTTNLEHPDCGTILNERAFGSMKMKDTEVSLADIPKESRAIVPSIYE
jgi:hypothetical protein